MIKLSVKKWLPPKEQSSHFELVLKVRLRRDETGFSASRHRAEARAERSRRKRTLLSFQRPLPPGGEKKPPTRARGPQMHGTSSRIRLRPKALQCRGAATFLHRPVGQPGNDSNADPPVKQRRSG